MIQLSPFSAPDYPAISILSSGLSSYLHSRVYFKSNQSTRHPIHNPLHLLQRLNANEKFKCHTALDETCRDSPPYDDHTKTVITALNRIDLFVFTNHIRCLIAPYPRNKGTRTLT